MNNSRVFYARVLRIVGALMIGLVMIICAPASVPRMFGYKVYQIVSGSMEPAISVGSAIYVKKCAAEELKIGDVVAFNMEDFVIAHRIVSFDEATGEVYTKGDANEEKDMNPITCEQIIGKVYCSVPYIGSIMAVYASGMGRIYAFCFLIAGLMFQLVAGNITGKKEKDPETEVSAGESRHSSKKKKRLYLQLKIIALLILVAFLLIVAAIAVVLFQYKEADKVYKEAEQNYAKRVEVQEKKDFTRCPIEVDFDELQAINSEIIGWIYCEDTPINYPICHTTDDEYYLTHAYDKTETKNGAIFLETENDSAFSEANSILYGHHMKNGSMFASLAKWSEQSYFDSHSYMWLLTPEVTYRIDLFAGYGTDANSDTYTVFRNYGQQMSDYLENVIVQSDVESDVDISDETSHFVVMSTCEYSYENARYVLHGKLVPIERFE